MGDLRLGVAVIMGASALCFWCGLRVSRQVSYGILLGVTTTCVAMVSVFALAFHGRLLVAQVLPFSSAIVVGNWLLPGGGLLAGIVCGQRTIACWRRASVLVTLLALAFGLIVRDCCTTITTSKQAFRRNGVEVQTTPVSCSPCAAATLLNYHGISSNEREMVELCLTGERGTLPLGLYRGLKLKVQGTGWDVETVRSSLDELRQSEAGPMIALLQLPPTYASYDSYSKGPALPGGGHAVVLFGFTDEGKVDIGDPSDVNHGRIHCPVETFAKCWTGEGLRLTRRTSFRSLLVTAAKL